MSSEITGEQHTATVSKADRQYASFREFWPFYVREHQRPITRALHFVGSTAVLAIMGLSIGTGKPWFLVGMPLVGYGMAWIGHFGFEKNRPATFKYPLYSLAGDWVMFGKMLSGTMRGEVERALAADGGGATASRGSDDK
jgi:hypothetical protein